MEEVSNTIVTETESASDIATDVKQEATPFVSPTEDELKKMLQSERSKAKYSLLQELGIKDVKDFKDKQTLYDAAIKENEELKSSTAKTESSYKEEIDNLKTELVLSQANINDDYKNDIITLAKSRVSDTVDFKAAVNDVLEKNPSWKKTSEPLKMGVEKSNVAQVDTVSKKLNKKYSWIHD